MIFAALLSAAFIGIVAVNLNQTARLTDKNRANDSAKAGLDFVNRQLAYSPQGERWYNATYAPIEAALQVDPNLRGIYYTPLDKAQGWDQGYIKFPDPRSEFNGGPQFLTKVERVPFNLPVGAPDFDKSGALKITVIGLSSEDATAYHKTVAYKGGFQRSPIAQTMRVVSNFDFKTENVLVAQANPVTNNGTGTPALLSVTGARGDFSTLGTPFTITVSDPRPLAGAAPLPASAEGAVVTNVTKVSATDFTFTLAQPLTGAPAATARVELAANIGAPTGIDYDNTNTPVSLASSAGNFRLSDGPAGTNTEQVDGGRFNGGLLWSGELLAQKLRAFRNSYNATVAPPGTIKASGAIALDRTGTSSVAIASADGDITVPDTLIASSDLAKGVFATSLTADKDQLVSDGWNRLKGVTPGNANGSVRSVSDFIPPAIGSGPGYDRYRNIARSSQPVANSTNGVLAQTNNALYGYGTGIYIDNILDRERIFDTTLTVPALRDMTQTELTQMWLSTLPGAPATVPDYFRSGVPTATTDPNYNNVSLEQKHLRGWIGPDEFRARGVEIELGDNRLTITRDARDEASQSSPLKTWKNPTNGLSVTGRYTEILPWPTTGVVFAEGNVRIKGTATNVPNSLTVVSMGNIYIEGDLQIASFMAPATAPKILLMAKKNVVMNPTRLLERQDVQTTLTQAATLSVANNQPVSVVNSFGFKKGDLVQIGNAQGYVNSTPALTPNVDNTLMVDVVTAGTAAIGDVVFTPNAMPKAINSTLVTPNRTIPVAEITNGTDVVQRRFTLPATLPVGVSVNDLRLAFNHEAERKTAASVAIQVPAGSVGPTSPVYFSHKVVFRAPGGVGTPVPDFFATVLAQADRNVRGDYTEPTAGTDTFPTTTRTTEADATAATIDSIFAAGSGSMNAPIAAHSNSLLTPPFDWQYTTSVTAYGNLPLHYLAGVGSRVDFGAATVPADRRRDLNNPNVQAGVASTPYAIPLATSINIAINSKGDLDNIFNENWNTTLLPPTYTAPSYDRTNQFGFRPTFVDPATPAAPNEDVLTSDQSFYQTDPLQTTLDSRNSPFDATTNPTGLNVGDNSLVLRQSSGLIAPTTGTLPAYRILGNKLESVTITPATSIITAVTPAYTFNVNAYVYAQTGSWFVIPGQMFDERLRGNISQTYLDANENLIAEPGEFIKGVNALGVQNTGTGWEVGDFADLNRNGIIDPSDQGAMLRYNRYNYSINFSGAIAENQTALVNDVGTAAKGAVNDWMSKWATTRYDVAAATPVTHSRIQYTFDPSVAQGELIDDRGFLLPQTTELYNIS
jgi:hypothetical protein